MPLGGSVFYYLNDSTAEPALKDNVFLNKILTCHMYLDRVINSLYTQPYFL